ncbi:hypothetical protein AGMMS49545_24220 [Betaproteobacteria bacterium]|nr:hypothetical protein AGMMS49545_24220 [Betaproteobacteria bacterium]
MRGWCHDAQEFVLSELIVLVRGYPFNHRGHPVPAEPLDPALMPMAVNEHSHPGCVQKITNIGPITNRDGLWDAAWAMVGHRDGEQTL